MPIQAWECPEGHTLDTYLHSWQDFGCRSVICRCGHSMAPALSVGRGLTYFEEARARVVHNLGPDPVRITSFAQHERLMRERGVRLAEKGDLDLIRRRASQQRAAKARVKAELADRIRAMGGEP